jgi:thymidylate synthase ThyX
MLFTPTAKIILDSVSPNDHRLTTFEVNTHRFVLAEFNTHRVFTRNSASSRAIPFNKMVKKAKESTAFPVSWLRNQPGMQGGNSLAQHEIDSAVRYWMNALDKVVEIADKLANELKLHKQVVNRLLEPWLPHTIALTSTEWDNFFWQRCHKDAQPEIKAAADDIQYAYFTNKNINHVLYGGWHTPYIDADTYEDILNTTPPDLIQTTLKQVSAARCARVSYLTQDGIRDYKEDLALYNRLINADVLHASPLEHVATPAFEFDSFKRVPHTAPRYRLSNFVGWNQFRHEIQDAIPFRKFVPNHPLLINQES